MCMCVCPYVRQLWLCVLISQESVQRCNAAVHGATLHAFKAIDIAPSASIQAAMQLYAFLHSQQTSFWQFWRHIAYTAAVMLLITEYITETYRTTRSGQCDDIQAISNFSLLQARAYSCTKYWTDRAASYTGINGIFICHKIP